jgi:predicted enzyme related to lactoylglutathione lyase
VGSPTVGWIQIDCSDPIAQAEFWGRLLGLARDEQILGEPPHYVGLMGPAGHPQISFQRVPEGKVVKNRIHLDITTDDLDRSASEVVSLGGRALEDEEREQYGYRYRIMADPEGNEFCLILGELSE